MMDHESGKKPPRWSTSSEATREEIFRLLFENIRMPEDEDGWGLVPTEQDLLGEDPLPSDPPELLETWWAALAPRQGVDESLPHARGPGSLGLIRGAAHR